MQYLGVLIHEYLYLQSYVPRALDWPDLLVALRFLPNLTDPPAELNRDAGLRSLWASLTEVVRRELAWGDLGTLRPARAQIETGWDGSVIGPGDHFGAATMIEPVMVLGAVYSFRLADSTWYLRPATIFEAKALANTMLYILDISGSVDDVALYYRRVYLVAKDDLEPDYLFLLDVLARMHNQSDFESVLATGDSAFVRHILVVASGSAGSRCRRRRRFRVATRRLAPEAIRCSDSLSDSRKSWRLLSQGLRPRFRNSRRHPSRHRDEAFVPCVRTDDDRRRACRVP